MRKSEAWTKTVERNDVIVANGVFMKKEIVDLIKKNWLDIVVVLLILPWFSIPRTILPLTWLIGRHVTPLYGIMVLTIILISVISIIKERKICLNNSYYILISARQLLNIWLNIFVQRNYDLLIVVSILGMISVVLLALRIFIFAANQFNKRRETR
jgi:hypothetical protein